MMMNLTYPHPTNIINKMSLHSVLLNNDNSSNSSNESNTNLHNKPFYLYKGLNPEREEALKIYPNKENKDNYYTYSSYSPISEFSSSDNEIEIGIGIEVVDKTNETTFKCNYPCCRYKGTFLSKDYLRRHIREQHRRSKEHICKGYNLNGEKWGCNKKFSRPYQLVNHWKGQRSLKRCGVPEVELKKRGII